MTTLSGALLALMLLAAMSRRYWIALAAGGATPIGAAVLVGDTAVPTFYAASFGAIVVLIARACRATRVPEVRESRSFQGAGFLLAFAVWAVITTITAPLFLFGESVYRGPNPDSVTTIGSVPTVSNIAQMGYLLLSVGVVFYLAQVRRLGPQIVGLAAIAVTLLSFWRFLSQSAGLPFPQGLFDNNTTYNFIETLPGGAPRFRGILSEPAGLAVSSLVTIAFSISAAARARRWQRVGYVAVAAVASIMAASSTSTTFVVVALLLLVISGSLFIRRLLRERSSRNPLPAISLIAVLAALVFTAPLLIRLVSGEISSKVGSSSYGDRTVSDNYAYELVIRNFGFGVGLGSNRASSFVAFLVSTTGLLGGVLFACAVLAIVWQGVSEPRLRPALWALVALLLTKVVSSPDLADSSGLLYLCLGLFAWHSTQVRRDFSAGLGQEGLLDKQLWPRTLSEARHLWQTRRGN